ncbi:hypothetical protein [Salinivibrio sp. VYel1]|uniref:hypothetical protein n=1 Tax=Salinivibrio sp. VYel1 TaxID=2490490 RepID=UPI00128D150B|nr:hypothetical protein [Salinivibrio sp. VYel1]MPX91048.1 hypothetical protein [Salinivibrio sp. VYel1]
MRNADFASKFECGYAQTKVHCFNMKESNRNEYYIWVYGGLSAFCMTYILALLSAGELVHSSLSLEIALTLNVISLVIFTYALGFHLYAKEKRASIEDIENTLDETSMRIVLTGIIFIYLTLLFTTFYFSFISSLAFLITSIVLREKAKPLFKGLHNEK